MNEDEIRELFDIMRLINQQLCNIANELAHFNATVEGDYCLNVSAKIQGSVLVVGNG